MKFHLPLFLLIKIFFKLPIIISFQLICVMIKQMIILYTILNEIHEFSKIFIMLLEVYLF